MVLQFASMGLLQIERKQTKSNHKSQQCLMGGHSCCGLEGVVVLQPMKLTHGFHLSPSPILRSTIAHHHLHRGIPESMTEVGMESSLACSCFCSAWEQNSSDHSCRQVICFQGNQGLSTPTHAHTVPREWIHVLWIFFAPPQLSCASQFLQQFHNWVVGFRFHFDRIRVLEFGFAQFCSL